MSISSRKAREPLPVATALPKVAGPLLSVITTQESDWPYCGEVAHVDAGPRNQRLVQRQGCDGAVAVSHRAPKQEQRPPRCRGRAAGADWSHRSSLGFVLRRCRTRGVMDGDLAERRSNLDSSFSPPVPAATPTSGTVQPARATGTLALERPGRSVLVPHGNPARRATDDKRGKEGGENRGDAAECQTCGNVLQVVHVGGHAGPPDDDRARREDETEDAVADSERPS